MEVSSISIPRTPYNPYLKPDRKPAAGSGTVAEQSDGKGQGRDAESKIDEAGISRTEKKDFQELSPEEKGEVLELKRTDAEVKAHEQAHLASAGPYATSGAQYEYKRGPDGNRYAVAGEVGIDTSEEDTPEKTVRKMQTVRSAALAPGDPSAQDRAVAATAAQKESEARREMVSENKKSRGYDSTDALSVKGRNIDISA